MLGKFILSVAILTCFSFQVCLSQNPVINEVMYSNRTGIADHSGDNPDWIEIYNPDSMAINLEDWQLSDDISRSQYWSFPAYSLGPYQFLVVFLSGKNRLDNGEIHTDFRLKLMEEPIILFDPEGRLRFKYEVQCVPPDISIGMKPDASGNIVLLHPSPGFSNNQSTTVQINYKKDTIFFSHPNGLYKETIQLELMSNYAHNTIYYTLNGSMPDDRSSKYEQALSLEDQTGRENLISGIRTSEQWISPGNDIYKFPVVRAVVYSQGCPASPVYSKSFFINKNIQNKYEIPVVSLITDPENLFDKEYGIYVRGKHENYGQGGKEWERPAHFEYFDPDGELQIDQNIDIRIHGGGSRSAPQKSLRLYARDKYGTAHFQYPFFKQKPALTSFKTLILRSVRDWSGTMFKEELCHHLVRDLDLDYMAGQTVIAFINGEYWGIHSLRERQDINYVRNNHQISISGIDIIAHALYSGLVVEEGDETEYTRLLAQLESSDLSDDNIYRSFSESIDLQNFIDYYITELYFANGDFPHNNVKIWRPHEGDGKWRLFFFDCDNCMTRTNYDHISEYTNPSDYLQIHEDWTTFIFQKLLENKEFRDSLYHQFLIHLNSTFHPDTVLGMIDRYKALYLPLVPEHIYRWHIPNDVIKWMHNTDMLTKFALQRPSHIILQLVKNFGNAVHIYPNPTDGNFHIQHFMGESDEIKIEITSMTGTRVYIQTIIPGNGDDIRVEVDLPGGVYLLSVKNKNMIFSEKLFVYQ